MPSSAQINSNSRISALVIVSLIVPRTAWGQDVISVWQYVFCFVWVNAVSGLCSFFLINLGRDDGKSTGSKNSNSLFAGSLLLFGGAVSAALRRVGTASDSCLHLSSIVESVRGPRIIAQIRAAKFNYFFNYFNYFYLLI